MWDAMGLTGTPITPRNVDRLFAVPHAHNVARESGRSGHRISLRVSDELFQRINERAKRDRRSLAQWVRQRLEDAVAAAPPSGGGPRKRAG